MYDVNFSCNLLQLEKWRLPSLSKLSLIELYMELTHLGSEVSKYCLLKMIIG